MRANTLLAHRVLWLARQRDVQEAVKERLLRAYFTEGGNVGDPDTLADLAAECGLDREEVLGFLASDAGEAEVAGDLTEALELGITAVPTYVFDGRWSVPGAQEPDTFLRVLERVAELEAAGAEPSDPRLTVLHAERSGSGPRLVPSTGSRRPGGRGGRSPPTCPAITRW